MKLKFPGKIFEESCNIKFNWKICPVKAELLHAGQQTDRHDEADSRFPQSCESDYKQKSCS